MKSFVYFLFIVFIVTQSLFSAPPDKIDYTPVEIDGKWGYLNNKGKLVIEAKFDLAFDFEETNLAPVEINGSWAYINKNGEVQKEPRIIDFFEWDDSYSTNIKETDEQHKRLVYLINRLTKINSFKGSERINELRSIIRECFDYALYHFQTEEVYMRKHDYPNAVLHKKEHSEFTSKVVNISTDFSQGMGNIDKDISVYLKSWLVNHMTNTDRKFGIYLNMSGEF